MLHELLFALSGYTGDVFVRVPVDPSVPSKTFAMAADFPLVHATEREALNRLAHLGWIYHALASFIEAVQQRDPTAGYAVYMQAYASSLAHVLDEYQALLADLETRLIQEQEHTGPVSKRAVSLALLTSTLGRWELTLPALLRVTEKAKQLDRHQEKLLDLLTDQVRTGIPEVHDATTRILHQLHHVFYRQIMAWIVYGQLPTQNDHRFFIVRDKTAANGNATSTSNTNTAWTSQYKLAADRLPKHIPLPLAESIFYIGKVVATTQEELPVKLKDAHLRQLANVFQTTSQHTSWDQQRVLIEKTVRSIRQSITTWLSTRVFQQEQYQLPRFFESFRDLFLVGDGDLAVQWLQDLERIDAAAVSATMTVDNDTTLKKRPQKQEESTNSEENDEFWPHAAREWGALLVKAAATAHDDDERMMDRLDMLLVRDSYAFEVTPGFSPFSDLLDTSVPCHLVYKLAWPMDLFLSPKDIQQYSYLWSFLIALKKVQQALAHAFVDKDRLSASLASPAQGNTTQNDAFSAHDERAERLIWRLRSWMLFWVDTLWSHLQADVVTSHYDTLLQVCQEATVDIDKLRQAHTQYLSDLMQGCLLSSEDATHAVLALLQSCMAFRRWLQQHTQHQWHPHKRKRRGSNTKKESTAAKIVQSWVEPTAPPPPWLNQLLEMEESFIAQSRHLFDLLLQQPQPIKNSGFLDRLLTRLDYNNWYSDTRLTRVLQE